MRLVFLVATCALVLFTTPLGSGAQTHDAHPPAGAPAPSHDHSGASGSGGAAPHEGMQHGGGESSAEMMWSMYTDLGNIAYQYRGPGGARASGRGHPDHRARRWLSRAGTADKAEPLYRRSLAIFEHAAGWNHPPVLKALGGLAEVRRERGDPAEAERLLTRAIGVMDQSPDTLTVQTRAQQAQLLTTLALVYRDQGRSTEADAARARARSLSVVP